MARIMSVASLSTVRLAVFALSAAAVFLLGSSPRAAGEEINPRGKPGKFEVGNNASYYVWRDRDGWHVRTTTKLRQRKFSGLVEISGGKITSGNAVALETGGDRADVVQINLDRNKLQFDLTTNQSVDGFDFKLGPNAESLSFSLNVDGAACDRVFIGADSKKPDQNPFTLPARGAGN